MTAPPRLLAHVDRVCCASQGELLAVEVTPIGTPILSSMISSVKRQDPAPLVMFANADIVFTPGIRAAVQAACRSFTSPFLLIGQRFEIPLKSRLPWSDKDDLGWTAQLRTLEASPEAFLKVGRRASRDSFGTGVASDVL